MPYSFTTPRDRRHLEAENYLGLLDAQVVLPAGPLAFRGPEFDIMGKDGDPTVAARRLSEHLGATWVNRSEEGYNLIYLHQPLIVHREDREGIWLFRLRGGFTTEAEVSRDVERHRFFDVLASHAQQAYRRLGVHP